VLVLDDLQWADDESLNAIDHLVAVAAALPVVLVCGARPELLQRRPDWGAAWPTHQTLTLAPLATEAGDALARALLQRMAEPSPQLQTLLSSQAAGNPYYMEALLQMLVDRGVIQTEGEHWRVQEDRLQNLQVPPTLVGVLQATLDALAAGERQSLQQASVVGAQFWDDALAAINPQAPAHLPALARRELALAQLQSAFDRTQEYAFRHHLLHQVTYGTVLKPDKREGHHLAALWLQARSAGREAEMAGQMAEHFERAGVTERAIHYWTQAAEDASRRQVDTSALVHAGRALALDDGTDLQRQVRLHRVRAAVFLRAGQAAEHADAVHTLESLADRLDDDVLRLAVANDHMWRLCLDTRFDEAVQLGERRLAQAEARASADAARVHNVMFVALSRLGRFDEALAHAEQGLQQAHAAGDLLTQGAINNNIAVNHLNANRVLQAQDCLVRALQAYNAAGSRNGAVTVYNNQAVAEEALCQYERARDLLLQTVQVCQEIGSRAAQGLAGANLAIYLFELGDPQGAHACAMRSLALARDAGDRWAQATAHGAAHIAAQALGRLPEALEHGRAAYLAFADHADNDKTWMYWSATASTLAAAGEPAQALAEAEAVLADVAEKGGWAGCTDGPMYLYRVLAPLGDPRAPALLATAHQSSSALADSFAELVPRDHFMQSTALRRATCAAWAAAQAT